VCEHVHVHLLGVGALEPDAELVLYDVLCSVCRRRPEEVPVLGRRVHVHLVCVGPETVGGVAGRIERHREERDVGRVAVVLCVSLDVSLRRDKDGADGVAVAVEEGQQRRPLDVTQAHLARLDWCGERHVWNPLAPRGIGNVAAVELPVGFPESDIGVRIADTETPETASDTTGRADRSHRPEQRPSMHILDFRPHAFEESGATVEGPSPPHPPRVRLSLPERGESGMLPNRSTPRQCTHPHDRYHQASRVGDR